VSETDGVLSSLLRRVGREEWFAGLARQFVPLDRTVGRLTQGRFVAFGLRELPSLLITTTGRRSGLPRSNPLLYAPDGDAFVVIGSNWGQRHHPAWSTNLLANPEATVLVDGERIPVRARPVSGAERGRLHAELLLIWPGYADYERRAGRRKLRVFRLERRPWPLPPAR
jgi:deazaflavin-dependent oxidoreductase (nitroreductase family)